MALDAVVLLVTSLEAACCTAVGDHASVDTGPRRTVNSAIMVTVTAQLLERVAVRTHGRVVATALEVVALELIRVRHIQAVTALAECSIRTARTVADLTCGDLSTCSLRVSTDLSNRLAQPVASTVGRRNGIQSCVTVRTEADLVTCLETACDTIGGNGRCVLRLPFHCRVVIPTTLRAVVTAIAEGSLLGVVTQNALVKLLGSHRRVRLGLELRGVRHLHAMTVHAELIDDVAGAAVVDFINGRQRMKIDAIALMALGLLSCMLFLGGSVLMALCLSFFTLMGLSLDAELGTGHLSVTAGIEVAFEVTIGLELEVSRVTCPTLTRGECILLQAVTAEAGGHLHEVVVASVEKARLRIDINELDIVLRMRHAVVTHGAVNISLCVHSMIDDDAGARGYGPVRGVTLRALVGTHVLRVHRQVRGTVQRDLKVVSYGQVEFAERLSLVQDESQWVCGHRHVARHAGDVGVRRCVVRRDRVVLDFVACLRAEPVARCHPQSNDHDPSNHEDANTRPNDVPRPADRILESGQGDSGHTHLSLLCRFPNMHT